MKGACGEAAAHLHATIFFHDPDSDHPRQVNIEDADTESGYRVTAAGSQAHLPDIDVYVEEADRLVRVLLTAIDDRDNAR